MIEFTLKVLQKEKNMAQRKFLVGKLSFKRIA